MKIKLNDYGKGIERMVDTNGFTVKQWIAVNFGTWLFYHIVKKKNGYLVYDNQTGEIAYEITK